MGSTFVEKVLALKSGREKVIPGEFVNAKVDGSLANDVTSPLLIERFKEMGIEKPYKLPSGFEIYIDHYVSAPTIRTAVEVIKADADAVYEKTYHYDVSALAAQIAVPPRIDMVKAVEEVEGLKIDQVYIGSCVNGGLEDMAMAARILKGRKIHPEIRCIVIPQSKEIYQRSAEKGYIQILYAAGAMLAPAGWEVRRRKSMWHHRQPLQLPPSKGKSRIRNDMFSAVNI